jgi:predicted nucleotidyltransferase
MPTTTETTDEQLRQVLAGFPSLVMALVFGSYAKGSQRADSDLDIAVQARQALTVTEKMALMLN